MRAGERPDLLVFEAKSITYVGEVQTITFIEDFSDWGQAQRAAEQECTFLLPYRDGITPHSHRIVFFDAYWMITSVLPDKRRTMLTIHCDLGALKEVTHMQSEVREYIDGVTDLRPRVEE